MSGDTSLFAVQRVIKLFYGFQFFFGMLLWVPIFYDYQKKMGLNDSQIFGIQSIYYLAFCLMEIPTGFLADFWGHRICMKAGAVVLTVANLLPVLLPSYTGFLAHFLLVALARSLISGASSAYLYDYLKAHDQIALYKRAEGNARSYGLVGKVVLWAGIGSLMAWHLSLPYWLTAGFSLISVAYAFLLPPLPEVASLSSEAALKNTSRTQVWRQLGPVYRVLQSTPSLILIMLQGIGIFVLARIVSVNLFQPVLSAKSFGLEAYGIVMSGMTIFEAIGSAYPHYLRKWWSDLNSVFILTVVMGASVVALTWGGQIFTVVCLCIFALAAGLSYPVQRQLLNDAIPDSRYRATLMSIESLADRAVCAWVAAMLAGYVGAGQMNEFLIVAGCSSILGMLVLYGAVKRSSVPF